MVVKLLYLILLLYLHLSSFQVSSAGNNGNFCQTGTFPKGRHEAEPSAHLSL